MGTLPQAKTTERKPASGTRVPVLMYHGISSSAASAVPAHEQKFWVSQSNFRTHLKDFRERNVETVLLADAWHGRLKQAGGMSPVLLTFDDGHASDYEAAFPVLAECGSRADFFVNTATVSTRGYLSWNQIAEMQKAGMGFHSHGHDHVVLARLSRTQLKDQLQRSKQILGDKLGSAVLYLGAPYGFLNRAVISVALEVGYEAVCTSWPWPARVGSRAVSRISIHAETSLPMIRRIVGLEMGAYIPRAVRTAALELPKRVLLRFNPELLHVSVLKEDHV